MKMSSFRASLLSRMIALYGYEHEITIAFANMCESWAESAWNNKCLAVLVKSHEADPVTDDEDF